MSDATATEIAPARPRTPSRKVRKRDERTRRVVRWLKEDATFLDKPRYAPLLRIYAGLTIKYETLLGHLRLRNREHDLRQERQRMGTRRRHLCLQRQKGELHRLPFAVHRDCALAGIPARFTIGFPLGEPSVGKIPGYHCWAEFYTGGQWVPVDASEAWKHPQLRQYNFGHLDADRVAFTMGRDLVLKPRQSGNLYEI